MKKIIIGLAITIPLVALVTLFCIAYRYLWFGIEVDINRLFAAIGVACVSALIGLSLHALAEETRF